MGPLSLFHQVREAFDSASVLPKVFGLRVLILFAQIRRTSVNRSMCRPKWRAVGEGVGVGD